MKRNARLVSLALCVLWIFSLAACSGDKYRRVIATVNDVEIYLWELENLYETNRQYNLDMLGYDMNDSQYTEKRIQYREELLEELINSVIVTEKAKELGYGLTEEEKAAVDQEFQQLKEDKISEFMEAYTNDADAQSKAEKDWIEYLDEQYMTEEFLLNNMYDAAITQKFTSELNKDNQPTEEELKEAYDQYVESKKTQYEENPKTYYEEAMMPGAKVFYNLPGYVRVKQILVSIPEDIDAEIQDLSRQLAALIEEAGAISVEKGEQDESVQSLQNQGNNLQIKIDALYQEGYDQIRSTINEAYQKLQNGEDFDTVMMEYSDDPSLESEALKEYGLLVGEDSGLKTEFVKAALELENIGDISGIVETTSGYHIIELVSKVEEGPVAFEEVKDYVRDLLMVTPQYDAFTSYAEEHKNEFTIKRYVDRI